jgi:bifunctional N-acetylglucosamine-1-phosphate-uridyltransferase/glucosamine-1-phosphate-acetyltransferase GlmU-like protein
MENNRSRVVDRADSRGLPLESGDARIGAGSNIGAGTITCNYDGFFKG